MTLYELNEANFLDVCVKIQFVDTSKDYEIMDICCVPFAGNIMRIDDETQAMYPHFDDYEVLSICADRLDNYNDLLIDLEIPEDEEDR